MKYVYLLQSLSSPNQRYIGLTEDLDARLHTHNAGGSPHTSKYQPWKIVLHLCFHDDRRAIEFERYLKSGSGHAFAKNRFW
jgi:predicted GIY-YIG superfamily endonuclease